MARAAPPPSTEFPERHREVREDRGLSQVQLSYAMFEADVEEKRGYDPSFIARVERGLRKPPPRYMLLLGRALKPTVEELPEYHLAMARRALDESEVEMEDALANLERLDLGDVAGDDEVREAVDDVAERLPDVADDEAEAPPSRPETAPRRAGAKGRRSAAG